jgi:hypothetical protein
MLDIVFIELTLVLFAITGAIAVLCNLLWKQR